ncbi:MAG: HAMP domain-containing sensor histidine kinase [Pseudomonadota bacterium]
MILEQDARGTILSASEGSWTLFDRPPSRFRGLQLTELIDPKHHPEILSALSRAMVRGQARVSVELNRQGRGASAEVTIRKHPRGHLRTVLREVPPLVEDEPERALTLKSDQLADVSHELRTPLNAVIGFADALRQESFGPLGDHRYRDYAKAIQESGQHVLSLVNDLLDLSKAEADKVVIEAELIHPAEILDSCVAMMRLEAERAGLEITSFLPSELGTMRLDPKILRQIVLNLLSNALKFTNQGGIAVRAMREGNDLCVHVRDTGVGMSAGDLERIGERFYQVRSEGVRGTRGSGLGLALSHALARTHGGELTLASQEGKGTVATLRLPSAALPERAARRYAPLHPPKDATVLPFSAALERSGH